MNRGHKKATVEINFDGLPMAIAVNSVLKVIPMLGNQAQLDASQRLDDFPSTHHV